MSVFWSYAATGLAISLSGSAIGARMAPRLNRPGIYQSPTGELAFSCMGLILTALMLFFGFRVFWDNGLWGLLQLLLVSAVAGWLSHLRLLQNGLTPVVFCGLGIAQAAKIW